MAIEITNALQAMGSIAGGSPATIVYAQGWNAASLTRNAAGDYQLSLDNPLAAANAGFDASIIGAAASVAAFAQSVTCIHTTDTSKRITTSVGGALADQAFVFKFWKIPGT